MTEEQNTQNPVTAGNVAEEKVQTNVEAGHETTETETTEMSAQPVVEGASSEEQTPEQPKE